MFDATNTTRQRRELLRRRVVDEKGFKLFFVESVCDDERIIENNIRSVKVKRTSKTQRILIFKQNSASDTRPYTIDKKTGFPYPCYEKVSQRYILGPY